MVCIFHETDIDIKISLIFTDGKWKCLISLWGKHTN